MLVVFCLNDLAVNVRREHLQTIRNGPLETEKTWDKSHTYPNLQQIFQKFQNGNGALPRFQNQCFRFAGLVLKAGREGLGRERVMKKLKKYLKGAGLLGYTRVIPPHRFNWDAWRSYDIDILLEGNDALNTVVENSVPVDSDDTWYLCLEYLIDLDLYNSCVNPGPNPGNNPGPIDPGPSNPGPSNSGPSYPGPINPGPST